MAEDGLTSASSCRRRVAWFMANAAVRARRRAARSAARGSAAAAASTAPAPWSGSGMALQRVCSTYGCWEYATGTAKLCSSSVTDTWRVQLHYLYSWGTCAAPTVTPPPPSALLRSLAMQCMLFSQTSLHLSLAPCMLTLSQYCMQ